MRGGRGGGERWSAEGGEEKRKKAGRGKMDGRGKRRIRQLDSLINYYRTLGGWTINSLQYSSPIETIQQYIITQTKQSHCNKHCHSLSVSSKTFTL